MNYLVVTPLKNEEKDLPGLIESMASQSILPLMWIIMDDGSTDKSPMILLEAVKKYKWIRTIRMKESPRDLSKHVAGVIKKGYDIATGVCRENNIEFEFIGFLDADIKIEDTDLFKKFIIEFERDSRLGIAGGNLYDESRRIDTISGGAIMCRREFFEQINGFPAFPGWDSILRVKAILNGWGVRTFKDIRLIQTRATGTAEGVKRGFYIKGTIDYYLGYNPLLVAGKGLKYCIEKSNYIGLIYLYGYYTDLILRKVQIDDKQIRNYYHNYKFKEILKYYIKNLRK